MKFPEHNLNFQFKIQDNCLAIGNQKITDIVDRAGMTPLYLYGKAQTSERITYLRECLPPEIKIHYAIKANPMPELVKYISKLVDGLDVASGDELKTALSAHTNKKHISFAGPGKSDKELKEAILANIVINAESLNEILRAQEIGTAHNIIPNIALRVNPDFELKSSGMKMAGGPKPFGIDAEHIPIILNDMKTMKVNFVGFHIFSGSQNLRAEAICEAQNKTIELAIKLSKYAPNNISLLNIGGGFGIPYSPGDQPLKLEPIKCNLQKLLIKANSALPNAEIIIELGRYIIGEAGVYICKIIDRKVSRGHIFLITNGGLHHHLAASGNFGQVIRKNYPVCIANKMQSEDTELVSVVGPLCTPLDILASKVELPKADVGDYVALFQSGAYGYTASPVNFLSHPKPKEQFL